MNRRAFLSTLTAGVLGGLTAAQLEQSWGLLEPVRDSVLISTGSVFTLQMGILRPGMCFTIDMDPQVYRVTAIHGSTITAEGLLRFRPENALSSPQGRA